MMQEEEIVMGTGDVDDFQIYERRPMQNFSVVESSSSKIYSYSKLEIFAAVVITLGTISGGFMEGYSSPTISSMLMVTNLTNQNVTNPQNINDAQKVDNTSGLLNLKSILDFERMNISLVDPINIEMNATLNIVGVEDPKKISSTVQSKNESQSGENINQTLALHGTREESLHMSEEQASWFGSLLLLGACGGAFISSYVISLGRRNAILLSCIPRLIGWLLIAFSSSLFVIYMGRLLCGFSIGFVTSAGPIYISEISQSRLRGSLSCFVQLGVNIGIFLAVLLGTVLSWRWLAGVGVMTVFVYGIPTFFIPNSPAWLILKGRNNEARSVLRKLRSNPMAVEEEMQETMKSSENKRRVETTWSQLFNERRCRIPLLVVLLVTGINRFSGYNALIMYCSTFLHQAAPTLGHYWAAVAICFVQVLCTGASIPLVESLGRRKLLITSVVFMGLSLTAVGLYDLLFKESHEYSWIAVASAMMYVGAYSIGIGPLTWVILGEMFPLDAREKASAVVSVCNWLAAFIITKTFFGLEAVAGVAGTCFIYASICFVGTVLMYWFVPETKGCTLVEIETHFAYSQTTWNPFKTKIDQALSGILDQEAAMDTYSTFQ